MVVDGLEKHSWNSWGSRQSNLLVIICGSAASWMIKKVIHQRGGLHGRVTRTINLPPFNLHETHEYLRSRKFPNSKEQTRKALFLTMVTTCGVADNRYKTELISNSIEEAFF